MRFSVARHKKFERRKAAARVKKVAVVTAGWMRTKGVDISDGNHGDVSAICDLFAAQHGLRAALSRSLLTLVFRSYQAARPHYDCYKDTALRWAAPLIFFNERATRDLKYNLPNAMAKRTQMMRSVELYKNLNGDSILRGRKL